MKNATSAFPGFQFFAKGVMLLFVSALLFVSSRVNGQWTPVGPDDFDQISYGIADYISAAKGPGKSLYVAFQDQYYGYKAVAWKYVDDAWTKLGTEAISEGVAEYTDIAVNSQGVPYVVYRDVASGYKATVKKYNGSSWVAVGEEGISDASSEYTRIAIAPDDSPYIVYADYSVGSRATVKKFNGNVWVTVGSAGISIASVEWDSDIAIGSDSIPYILYSDFGLGMKVTMKKFNGTAWVDAGNPGISSGIAYQCQIALSSTNIPYIIYTDYAAGLRATVKRLSGSNWVSVGSQGFSVGSILSPTITIAPNNEVFVAYSSGGSVDVKKFIAGQWFDVGSVDYVNVTVDHGLSLVAIGNDSLCLAFSSSKANVACYNGNTWQSTKERGILPYSSNSPQLTISNFIVPYLTFPNFYTSYLPVMRYYAASWSYLPPLPDIGFDLFYPAIEATPDGSLYAAYVEEVVYDSGGIRVHYYDGVGWNLLSDNGLNSSKNPDIFDFAVDKTGIPYVAYDMMNNDQFAVSRFNGSAWELVGDVFPVDANDFEIAFSANNTPFIAYRDFNGGITVKKFNGVKWDPVGAENFVTSIGDNNYACKNCLNLDVGGDSTPYLLYTSEFFQTFGNPVIRILHYDGDQWKQIGDSLHVKKTNRVALDVAGNTPYVMYEDANENKGVVRKWDGETWTLLGGVPFSAGEVTSYPDLFVTNDRTVFVAYDNFTLYAKSYADDCTAPANINGPDTVLLNQTAMFSAPAGFTGYTWNASSGVVLNGQGTAHAQISFPVSGNIIVSITVTDSDGCTGTAMQNVHVPGVISTHTPLSPDVQIASNPFSDALRFEVFHPAGTVYGISVSDAVGRTWWEQAETREGAYYIETASWPPGTYFLQIKSGRTTATWRAVKM